MEANVEKGLLIHDSLIKDIERIWQKVAFQKILDVAGALILVLDANGNIVLINKRGCDILGYSEHELIGKNWFDNIVPELKRKELKIIFDDLISGKAENKEYYENPVLTKDGKEKFLSWHNALVKDDGGKILGILSSGEDITSKLLLDEDRVKNYDIQQTINFILQIFLEDSPIEELLGQVLDALLSISWLSLQSKGCIFLVDKEDKGFLVMKAQKNLATPLLTLCSRIKLGYCLCGRAGLTREIVFEGCLNEHHEITYDGISPHGHYCVPIVSNGELLGVINTYVCDGFLRNKRAEEFLSAIANALAGVLKRKEVEKNLFLYQKKLESKIKEMEKIQSLTIDRELKMIALKKQISELESKLRQTGVEEKK